MPFSRNQNMYSIERYDFEGVQLIEIVALFLFQMTVIPSVGGGSYLPAIFPKEVRRMPYFFIFFTYGTFLFHIHHFRRRDL